MILWNHSQYQIILIIIKSVMSIKKIFKSYNTLIAFEINQLFFCFATHKKYFFLLNKSTIYYFSSYSCSVNTVWISPFQKIDYCFVRAIPPMDLLYFKNVGYIIPSYLVLTNNRVQYCTHSTIHVLSLARVVMESWYFKKVGYNNLIFNFF